MFSTILPPVSTNMKFMHNSSSKPHNRYLQPTVNPNVAYVPNGNMYDLGYLQYQPADNLVPNWYSSSYNPPEYTIYSTSVPNSFVYDQSPQFLGFDDSSSITSGLTTSPAMSTDSIEALKSPVDPESPIDELGILQPENRALRTAFPFSVPSHIASVGRADTTLSASGDPPPPVYRISTSTTAHSKTDTPRALHVPFPNDFTDDSQSTISELEVEERDRIAKMNAEYNATSRAGFFTGSVPSQISVYPADSVRDNMPPQLLSMKTRPPLPLSVSRPRHPDLQFSQRPIGNDKADPSSSSYQIYSNPVLSVPVDLSPPRVERLPSQPFQDQNDISKTNIYQPQLSPPIGSRTPPDSGGFRPAVQNRTSSPTSFMSQDEYLKDIGKNLPLQSFLSTQASTGSAESQHKRRSSVVITNGLASLPLANDIHKNLQQQQSRPDVAGFVHPSANVKNQFPNISSDLRQDVITSSPHATTIKVVELESSDRMSLGTNFRMETKTPFSRGDSYNPSPPRSPPNIEIRDREGNKLSPSFVSSDKLGYVDNTKIVLNDKESESRLIDIHHGKASYESKTSPPISLDHRAYYKSRDSQFIGSTKVQLESPKREGIEVRISQSSPINKPAGPSSTPPKTMSDSTPTAIFPEPHRRHSDGDQIRPPIRPPLCSRNSAPLVRSVRWTENLIAPSPIMGPRRRKGWFNRRGDQLWTNHGDYRLPRSGDEYPLHLDDYPEPGEGWMNEDGIRIDMDHHRIPKTLPRPALKRPLN